jgi:AAA15 family ATPase/GTPase
MAHLTSFIVKNFKRFEHFEMNDIGQFNLIVGDNNVGKTSVLEALLITKSAEVWRWRMLTTLLAFKRFSNINASYLRYFANRSNPEWTKGITIAFICQPDYAIEIQYDPTNETALWNCEPPYGTSGVQEKLNISNGYNSIHTFIMPYLPFFNGYEHHLAQVFENEIQERTTLREQLIQDMKVMLPHLINFDIRTKDSHEPHLIVFQNGIDPALPLGVFGDGVIKLFRILIEIILHSGNRLMIDEIDAGVHISRFKDFWRTILKASVTHNVQLFATTHNLECLQVFKEVLEEPEMVQYQEKVRCFTLIDSPVTKRVEAICSTFTEFENAVQNGTELRGGAIV